MQLQASELNLALYKIYGRVKPMPEDTHVILDVSEGVKFDFPGRSPLFCTATSSLCDSNKIGVNLTSFFDPKPPASSGVVMDIKLRSCASAQTILGGPRME